MAEKLVCIDRETPMLLPPDLRDWVADDDLAHFIIHVVGELPTGEARVNDRGTGSAQYPPGAMLALLLYCYSQGIYSSQDRERDTHPCRCSLYHGQSPSRPRHHRSLPGQCNQEYIKRAFVMTIRIGQELGFTSLGTMAIDGTSIRGNAGWKTSTTYERLDQLSAAICEERLRLAEQLDEREEGSSTKAPIAKAETIRKAIQHMQP